MEVSLCFIIVMFVNIFYFSLYFNYVNSLIYMASFERLMTLRIHGLVLHYGFFCINMIMERFRSKMILFSKW